MMNSKMNRIIKSLLILFICIIAVLFQSCNGRSESVAKNMINTSQSMLPGAPVDPNFGNYAKIDPYEIWIPFADSMIHRSTPKTDEYVNLVSYQYAYPSPQANINFMYGVDVFEIKNVTAFKDSVSKLDYCAKRVQANFEKDTKGVLVASKYNLAKDTLKQRIKFEIPGLGQVYSHSAFFMRKNLVVRLYAFTLKEEENDQMNLFFKSARYDLGKYHKL